MNAKARCGAPISAKCGGFRAERWLDTAPVTGAGTAKPGAASGFGAALQKWKNTWNAGNLYCRKTWALAPEMPPQPAACAPRKPTLQQLNHFIQRLEREIAPPAVLARALEDWQQLLEQAWPQPPPDVSLWQRLRWAPPTDG